MLQQRKVVVQLDSGLHARPAMMFVQMAQQYKSAVRLCAGSRSINGKSILELLTLAADRGTELLLEVEGEDETAAADALSAFLSRASVD